MPQAILLSKEEWQEVFSNPKANSKAHGEEDYFEQFRLHTTAPKTFATTII
jgi:hypothetical protein